ncbi:hypothetical protein PHMEG_00033989 [Phytophthora megakarya]|uniref:Uncharacterized protein n=1 Tax=Phytophthora megakarya TaxID=4795 RepID=A0A225USL5_9STRA|nr:hypothetical protein PHMEG_00033989 [Phytophthora megakarya]
MILILFIFLDLVSMIDSIYSTDIDVNGVAIAKFQASGSLDDVEILIQEEAQVVNTLIELDNQLTTALDHASSVSGAVEIEVVIEESDDATSGSKFHIDDEIVVMIPSSSKLSDEQKNEIKVAIENEVADTLDGIIVNEAIGNTETEQQPAGNKVQRLFEEEAEAEKELTQMQQELEQALDELPSKGPSTEIDIVVTESDDKQEVVDDEIVKLQMRLETS